MTEKEKMLAGQPYDSRDPELIRRYYQARKLLHQYNQGAHAPDFDREGCLKQLLGQLEEGVWIEAPFYCDYGENISIGAHTFLNVNCVLIDNNLIRIGSHCLLGPSVQIYTSAHPLPAEERIQVTASGSRYLTHTQPVTIGDKVWIGGNSVIFPGVTIGSGTTIGAGSVVTRSIPEGVLAYGNPCRVIRKL